MILTEVMKVFLISPNFKEPQPGIFIPLTIESGEVVLASKENNCPFHNPDKQVVVLCEKLEISSQEESDMEPSDAESEDQNLDPIPPADHFRLAKDVSFLNNHLRVNCSEEI